MFIQDLEIDKTCGGGFVKRPARLTFNGGEFEWVRSMRQDRASNIVTRARPLNRKSATFQIAELLRRTVPLTAISPIVFCTSL